MLTHWEIVMRDLQTNELEQVSGSLTADQGANIKLGLAGVAAVVGSGGLALFGVLAAAACYELADMAS